MSAVPLPASGTPLDFFSVGSDLLGGLSNLTDSPPAISGVTDSGNLNNLVGGFRLGDVNIVSPYASVTASDIGGSSGGTLDNPIPEESFLDNYLTINPDSNFNSAPNLTPLFYFAGGTLLLVGGAVAIKKLRK